jgi:hypothetical protein
MKVLPGIQSAKKKKQDWKEVLTLSFVFYSLARKGATPSQIGVVLRDSHGVALVRVVTGNKILRILKSNGTT